MSGFRPKEAARRLGIPTSTLRLWSMRFVPLLSEHAASAQGRHRRYSEEDLRVLQRAGELLRAGSTFEEALTGCRATVPGLPADAGSRECEVLQLFKKREAILAPKQRWLAERFSARPEDVVFGTLRSLSESTGVSTLTILRFAKALGFKGFQALQAALRSSYYVKAGAFTQDKASTSHIGGILELHRSHLQEVQTGVDVGRIDAVCRLLEQARRIRICATGTSSVLAGLLQRELYYAGISSEVISAAGVDMVIGLAGVGKGDVVVGIHLAMTFLDAVNAIKLAKSKGAQTIVIGGTASSPLMDTADYFLYAPASGRELHFSVVGLVALIEVLVARLIERRPEAAALARKTFLDLALEERLILLPRERPAKKRRS